MYGQPVMFGGTDKHDVIVLHALLFKNSSNCSTVLTFIRFGNTLFYCHCYLCCMQLL